jgi:hypothetical protein
MLTSLGFRIRACGSGGHMVYSHPSLKDFIGSNFNCGHRETEQIRPAYIRQVVRVIEEFQDQLEGLEKTL